MYAPIVRPYLARKLALPHKTLRKINWKASNQALRRMPKGKRRWLTKHTTGFCGVGRSMHIRKIWDHSRCPRCAQPDENPKHVLLCPSRGARLTWAEALVSLDKHLRKLGTNQSLRYGIIEHLRAWGKRSPPHLGPLRADVRAALAEQTEIGWYNLLLGRISHRFTQLQDAHYKSLGNRRNGFRWTTAVIRKLLDISWDMWDHRNHIKHNDPHPAFDPQLRTTLNEEIRFQWSLGAASLRPEDRPLFRHGLDSIMEQTTTDKQQWLASVENARSAVAADQVQPRNDQNYERNLMENWIIRGPPAN
ncbi:expressed unknown protein [Seminavis robusta]|uniref:Uncharacterized protein n=1 Tax=Seminavis robusta TaxID=568900 RepID=A0A9N8DBU2_9STRA|nr:expressed unknown protein [Seminavis robusta]|eukprot:Sro50_g028991.1  (305) ;mRNA; r:48837-49751